MQKYNKLNYNDFSKINKPISSVSIQMSNPSMINCDDSFDSSMNFDIKGAVQYLQKMIYPPNKLQVPIDENFVLNMISNGKLSYEESEGNYYFTADDLVHLILIL